MSAILSPTPGAAVIRRGRNRAHLAAVTPWATTATTFCDREVLVDGAEISRVQDARGILEHVDVACVACYRMGLAVVHALGAQPVVVPTAPVPPVGWWVEWYGHLDGVRLHAAAIGDAP